MGDWIAQVQAAVTSRFSSVVSTGKSCLDCLTRSTWVRITLADRDNRPIQNARFRLFRGGTEVASDNLNGEGLVIKSGLRVGQYYVEFPDIDQREFHIGAPPGASGIPVPLFPPGTRAAAAGGENATVLAGETIQALALRYGYRRWETVWEYSRNAPLRASRPDPAQLCVNDLVIVPAPEPVRLALANETTNAFWIDTPAPIQLRFMIRDESGRALHNLPCTLIVNGRAYPLVTDQGHIKQEIACTEQSCTLAVKYDPYDPNAELVWNVSIGAMEPVSTTNGVDARLRNLGFGSGADGIKRFKRYLGDPSPDAVLDIASREALEYLHNAF